MSDMKILTLDIETSPTLAFVWRLFKENISLDQIVEPTRMITYAAKWLGEDYVYYGHYKDEDFVEVIHGLLDEADAVVSYNGVQFDMKHLNREFIQAGLTPPSPCANIDLLNVVKKNFRFVSNKLDHVASELLGHRKIDTGGFKLWRQCILDDDPKAWAKMQEYNIADTVLTEQLYLKLRGWITNHPNHGLYIKDQDNPVCRNCGSTHVVAKGQEFYSTGVFAYQRYKCMNPECGANLRGRQSIKGRVSTSKQVLK